MSKGSWKGSSARDSCAKSFRKKRRLLKSTINREVEWTYANFRIFFRCIVKGRLRFDPSHLCKYLTFSQTLMHIRACGHRTFCVFWVCLSRKGKIVCQHCASSDWSSPQSVSHSFQKSILKDLEPQFFSQLFKMVFTWVTLAWHYCGTTYKTNNYSVSLQDILGSNGCTVEPRIPELCNCVYILPLEPWGTLCLMLAHSFHDVS